ncbi:hypothetical protein F4678DRAFT_475301 [Xylaria arbuscula]|nr:hypothetical protein F4678DRAFT_475301 [Xylaria arbuscula]
MTSNTNADGLATNLARAKTYYNEKQYPKAAALFKQVANSCVCGVQARSSPCCCKSLVPAITEGALEAELRKKCICSAKSDSRCKSSGHLDALDGLAAVYEARRLFDTAMVIAEAMIHLAPREPKGFLRLGRLLRLQRSYRQAFQTYQQGIELVNKRNPSHPLLSTLQQMRDKVKYPAVATDPLPVLPLELAAMILRYIDFRSLCRCLRVSKSWKRLLTSKDTMIQSLWRIQHFNTCTKPVRSHQLQKYATYSGAQVTELAIGNCRAFGIDSNTFRWIAASRSLRVLKLRSPTGGLSAAISRPVGNLCVSQLTSLYLGFHAPFLMEFVHRIVASSAATLQELTILNFPRRLIERFENAEIANWPVLEHLRTLRLGSTPGGPPENLAIFNLSSFMRTTPNVEEVWMEGPCLGLWGVNPNDPSGEEHPNNPWPHLRRLFVGQRVHWKNWQGIADSPPFLLPSGIEELHLMQYSHVSIFLIGPFTQSPDTFPEPKYLQKFTLRDNIATSDIWSGYLQRFLRASLESGALKELGMTFPKPHPYWLRSDQLKFLNLKGLSMEFGRDPFALDDALSDLLDRFPNLEGLDIAQEPFSNAALSRAIKRGVKLIYHRGEYHMRTELREWALKNHDARVAEGDYVVNLPMSLHGDKYKDFY